MNEWNYLSHHRHSTVYDELTTTDDDDGMRARNESAHTHAKLCYTLLADSRLLFGVSSSMNISECLFGIFGAFAPRNTALLLTRKGSSSFVHISYPLYPS